MKTTPSSKNVGDGGRLQASHRRLQDSFNLGRTRCSSKKGQLWHFPDFGIQKLVLHSMDSFLDCITKESSQHPLVKDSVEDMIGALENILECKSEATLRSASLVTKKLVNVLPRSLLQSHVLHLVHPLSSLLNSRDLQVSISCANALVSVLSTLSAKQEAKIWETLRANNAVESLTDNVKKFSTKDDPFNYLFEMVTLLSRILWLCPPSRFSVWNDFKLLDTLDTLKLPDNSFKVAVLQCYSGLALCGHAAKKLLENVASLTQLMLDCMDSSNPDSVVDAAFKLAQCLMISESGRTAVLKVCGKPLVSAIIDAIKDLNLKPGKILIEKIMLIEGVCCVALITHWAGDHQTYFWKEGICSVLLNILLNKSGQTQHSLQHVSMENKLNVLRGSMNKSVLFSLRSYIWDIIGGLAANCDEDFDSDMIEARGDLNLLITCACLAFVDCVNGVYQVSHEYNTKTTGSEPAARAVLLMLYSPCEYIASQSRIILSEILTLDSKGCVEKALNTLASCGKSFVMPSVYQLVISSIAVACYASLTNYRNLLSQNQGLSTILTFLKWLLKNPICIKRSNIARHLYNPMIVRSCCSSTEDWEGNDMLLMFSLWALGELLLHIRSPLGLLDIKINMEESQLVRELQGIAHGSLSPGTRWYAAHILCQFGQYGFPSKLGRKMREALSDVEFADLRLTLKNKEVFHVHKMIMLLRCPSLLPPEEYLVNGKSTVVGQETAEHSRVTDIRMSTHVHPEALLKLLEYVYLGYFEADIDLLRKLKALVKRCNLQPLLHMLSRKNPKWGTPIPKFDLLAAIGPAGHNTSDFILTSNTIQLPLWSCTSCSASVPHLHVHKVVLLSSCDYLRALFHSGLQESISQSVKVPVSWKTLMKLVTWFYSDDIPMMNVGCLWDNMDMSKKVSEFESYVELCWLSHFWLLEDLYEQCLKVAADAVGGDADLSVKVIQLAANLSQWSLVHVAATKLAPLYHKLRASSELDQLDESIIEIIREASVQRVKTDLLE